MNSLLLVASGNPGKVEALRHLLQDMPYTLVGLDSLGPYAEIEETGAIFEQNAQLKACGYARMSGLLTLADDSGLEVEALAGAPGIFSARYGGPGLDDRQRSERLLQEMAQHQTPNRRARFVCVVTVALPSGSWHSFRGTHTGHITHQPRGTQGFGYDPVFVPDGHDHTYAEMAPALKGHISHRALAMQSVCIFLRYLAAESAANT